MNPFVWDGWQDADVDMYNHLVSGDITIRQTLSSLIADILILPYNRASRTPIISIQRRYN